MIGPEAFLSQGEGVRSLMEQIQEGRVNHAVLISGEAGTGKWTLAKGLAAALLCRGEGPKPCGKCRACQQMEDLAHPDLIVLEKGKHLKREDEGKRNITIGDIREMILLTAQHGLEGNRRVVLIRHAEDMLDPAQNALLKILEEPPEGTFFLMTTKQPGMILPTVVSRCRPLKIRPWTEAELEAMLVQRGTEAVSARKAAQEAEGSIGQAIALTENQGYWQFREEVIGDWMNCPSRSDILQVSGKWANRKDEGEAAITLLERIFSRMLRRSLRISREETETGLPEKWIRFEERATPGDYVRILEGIALARERISRNVSLSAAMEQLLLLLMEASGK